MRVDCKPDFGQIYLIKPLPLVSKSGSNGYVGQTANSLHKRMQTHDAKTSSCTILRKALDVHGLHNFTIQRLQHWIPRDQLNDAEMYWVDKMDTWKNGYNCGPGGDSGNVMKDAGVQARHKASHNTPEYKAKMAPVIEKSHSPEANAKRVESYKATAATQEFKDKKHDIQVKLWQDPAYAQKITDARDVSLREKLEALRAQAWPLPPVEGRVLGEYYIDDQDQLRRWRKGSRLDILTIEVFEKERVRARAKNKRVREAAGSSSA